MEGSLEARSALPAGLPDIAVRAARTHCPLLIEGETGVGKGFAARWIHEHSDRAIRPFVPVNCGAIPESLIDSQLFGHARGAFTGADREHAGLVRAAEGGTLFLDEVSDLPMAAQARLLRLLEEREVQPVGHSRPVRIDARIMAATNVDLAQAVAEKRFREDLYFRLDVVRITLQPLRARRADIATMTDLFNQHFAAVYGHDPLRFDRAARLVMDSAAWPGNVRQVRSVVERLHVLVGPGTIITPGILKQFGRLEGPPLAPSGVEPPARRVAMLKTDLIQEALRIHDGNVSIAAAALGVHRSTIYRWFAAQQPKHKSA